MGLCACDGHAPRTGCAPALPRGARGGVRVEARAEREKVFSRMHPTTRVWAGRSSLKHLTLPDGRSNMIDPAGATAARSSKAARGARMARSVRGLPRTRNRAETANEAGERARTLCDGRGVGLRAGSGPWFDAAETCDLRRPGVQRWCVASLFDPPCSARRGFWGALKKLQVLLGGRSRNIHGYTHPNMDGWMHAWKGSSARAWQPFRAVTSSACAGRGGLRSAGGRGLHMAYELKHPKIAERCDDACIGTSSACTTPRGE